MSDLSAFHNPYNFVRTPKRKLEHDFGGDHDPAGREDHSRFWPDLYTGTIPIRLRTQSPLFLTDPATEEKDEKGHRTFDCLDHIPATALKGMLSSAYEIITNSRYRVFGKKQHEKRLGFRYPAKANLVPGRVTNEDGVWTVMLFKGTSEIGVDGAVDSNGQLAPLYAAWVPVYRKDRCGWKNSPQHGEWMENITLRLYKHGRGNFRFWSVVGNLRGAGEYTPVNTTNYAPVTGQEDITVNGYTVVTGKTAFSSKHDERFFFNTAEPTVLDLSEEVRERYEDLIADYQRVHENDTKSSREQVKYGCHINDPDQKTLRDGRFVYVKMKPDRQTVEAIYPVQISRELYDASPWDCLDASLRPAEKPEQLSPADRLFGWVAQGESGAWRGKIRISDGVYRGNGPDDKSVTRFETPMPLSILGGPKPSQARFYLGDRDGNPQKDGLEKKQTGYTGAKKLRGRKVYLHHSQDTEYRQLGDAERTNQNRSITGWIEPKKDFFFEIRVENLTVEELGAILTLLSKQFLWQNFYFRLGYAKPLGLGSVALSIETPEDKQLRVVTGDAHAQHYRGLKDVASSMLLTARLQQQMIQAYQKAMAEAYAETPENPPTFDRCLWAEHPFAGDLGVGDRIGFERAWNEALERGDEVAPLDQLPSKEEFSELYPELLKELETLYGKESADLKKQSQYDFGWSKLPFINDFMRSMTGFPNDEKHYPVHYPRNAAQRGEEGFRWFAANEKTTRGKVNEGLALPPIGTPLKNLQER